MKNKDEEFQSARNFVAKHMRAMNTPSIEIDRKKKSLEALVKLSIKRLQRKFLKDLTTSLF
jgi:hypothetical protein